MNKIGSEFLKEFDDYEPPFWWKFTLRQTVLLVGLLIVGALSTVVIIYQLPELFIYLLAGVILPPFVIYGLKKEEKLIDKLHYLLRTQERYYDTEYMEKEYQKDDFSISKKTFREDDVF